MAVPADKISEVMGEPARANPIRAYVGLESAPSEQERVDLAMRELERTGAFDRSWLMVASPTGTGYVNYAATSILEFLTRGDCASVAMQYSARPSPLSLDRVKEGRLHARMLCQAIAERCAQSPAGVRPKVLLFGESLGAWTSQDGFVDQGTQGLDRRRDRLRDLDRHARTSASGRSGSSTTTVPTSTVRLVGRFNDISEWEGLEASERERIRFVMITHYDDGVGVFGPELAIQAPDWLCDTAERHPTVPKGMRWMPTTSFFQVLVDMKNAANVVPGAFAAKGHDYRADLLPFFHGVLGLKASPEQLDAIHRPARGARVVPKPMGEGSQVIRQGLGGRSSLPADIARNAPPVVTPTSGSSNSSVRSRWRSSTQEAPQSPSSCREAVSIRAREGVESDGVESPATSFELILMALTAPVAPAWTTAPKVRRKRPGMKERPRSEHENADARDEMWRRADNGAERAPDRRCGELVASGSLRWCRADQP